MGVAHGSDEAAELKADGVGGDVEVAVGFVEGLGRGEAFAAGT